MTNENSRTDKKKIPASLLSFMKLNAAYARLDVPGLDEGGECTALAASNDQGLALADVGLVYRQFAHALNTHVYVQNSRAIPPPLDEYELLCYCMVSADTLSDGIQRAMKFVSALNGRGGTLSLSRNGERSVISSEVGWTIRSLSALSLDMLALTFYAKLFSWMIGEPLTGLELTFSHPNLLDPVYLRDLVPCRCVYDARQTALSFDAHLLSRPIVRTQRQLTDMLACGPLEFLSTATSASVSLQVKNLLRRALVDQQQVPSLDRVANQLGKSSSTLRRHLSLEGDSFQTLLDDCRENRARELLSSTQLPIDEIAWRVGFSERSAFSHAFKTWTGQTPTNYRDNMRPPALDTSSAA